MIYLMVYVSTCVATEFYSACFIC